ncbi:MAG: hypothetical protein J5697_00920 [Clostridia bacterium]|nr:hypothetical protein [Clostridia bacterium]
MDASKYDKNFNIKSDNTDGLEYYGIPCEPFDLYGVFYEEKTGRFVRMPSDAAKEISRATYGLNSNTAGGRIRFSTDSERICVSVKYETLSSRPHMSLMGGSGFVLSEERGDRTVFVYSFMPDHYANDKQTVTENGYTITKKVNDGKLKNYILYFPNYNDVTELIIGLDSGATVGHGKKYKAFKPVLYYGSSITQGACASRADNSYSALISKWTDTDFINLGFSGSACGEEKMAEYLAGIDCSVFVCGYDYNAPDPEYLKKTHYAFYRTYREKRKDTPIILISNPDTDENRNQAEERVEIIKRTYTAALAEGDKNVYFIDGKTLYGEADRENCTVDGIHPNDLGFYKMATVIYGKIKEILGEIVCE